MLKVSEYICSDKKNDFLLKGNLENKIHAGLDKVKKKVYMLRFKYKPKIFALFFVIKREIEMKTLVLFKMSLKMIDHIVQVES